MLTERLFAPASACLAVIAGGSVTAAATAQRAATPADQSADREAQLARAIGTFAQSSNASLPMRGDNGTITAMTANGTELTIYITLPGELDPAQAARARQVLQAYSDRNSCGLDGYAVIIRAGGRMVWRFTDPSGDVIETRVSTCPPAPAS